MNYYCKLHATELGESKFCPYCYSEMEYASDLLLRYGDSSEIDRLELLGEVIVVIEDHER